MRVLKLISSMETTPSGLWLLLKFRKIWKHLQADSSLINVIIKAIAQNSKCNNDEASEALLLAIYQVQRFFSFCCCMARSGQWDSPQING
jgi:hypothetical protein